MPDDNIIDISAVAKQPRIDPDEAFRLYVAGGARSLRKVAHTLGIPESTVMAWSARYKWNARLRDLDSETLQGIAQSVVVATASQQLQSIAALARVRDDPESPPRDVVQASRVLSDLYTRIAHLVPQLLPPQQDDDADILELVRSPDGVARLLQSHRDTAGKR